MAVIFPLYLTNFIPHVPVPTFSLFNPQVIFFFFVCALVNCRLDFLFMIFSGSSSHLWWSVLRSLLMLLSRYLTRANWDVKPGYSGFWFHKICYLYFKCNNCEIVFAAFVPNSWFNEAIFHAWSWWHCYPW